MSDNPSNKSYRSLSRRDFTVGGINLSLLALFGGSLACKTTHEDNASDVDATRKKTIRIRKNIWDLSKDSPDLVFYRAAIGEMSVLEASNPLSWEGQANIHVNSCPHNNWFFLPWHRVYLLHFENTIQYWAEQAGSKIDAKTETDPEKKLLKQYLDQGIQFALPYWDWTRALKMPGVVVDDPSFNHAAWPSPKKYQARRAAPRFSNDFMGKEVIDAILGTDDFYAFASGKTDTQRGNSSSGRLEGTPHNSVHGSVGGEMATYRSPLDPIFWMHHCNVDRMWAHWSQRLGDKAIPPEKTDFDAWSNFKVNGFFNLKGKAITAKVADTLKLGNTKMPFTYDSLSSAPIKDVPAPTAAIDTRGPKPAPASAIPTAGNITRTVFKGKKLNRVSVNLGPVTQFPVIKTYLDRQDQSANKYFIRISNLPVPTGETNGIKRLNFYLTNAAGDKLSKMLFTYTFFGTEPHGPHGDHTPPSQIEIYYDITDAMPLIRDSRSGFTIGDTVYLSIAMMDTTSDDGVVSIAASDFDSYTETLKSSGLKVTFSS